MKDFGEAAHLFTDVKGQTFIMSLVRSSTRMTDSRVTPISRGTNLFRPFIFSCKAIIITAKIPRRVIIQFTRTTDKCNASHMSIYKQLKLDSNLDKEKGDSVSFQIPAIFRVLHFRFDFIQILHIFVFSKYLLLDTSTFDIFFRQVIFQADKNNSVLTNH